MKTQDIIDIISMRLSMEHDALNEAKGADGFEMWAECSTRINVYRSLLAIIETKRRQDV
jgi:hypothetical protein